MATEIEPLIMPFDPLWVTTSKREYRATTHLVLDEDGRTCCAKCGCDYLCMNSATYCPDCGAKVAKNG